MSFNELLKISEETKNGSITTLEELNDQKTILNNLNQQINHIDKLIIKSNRVINTMKSITSHLFSKLFKNDKTQETINKEINDITNNTKNTDCYENNKNNSISNKINNDTLDIIINNIQVIKEINLNISDELDEQNELLDNITKNTELSNINLKHTEKNINSLL